MKIKIFVGIALVMFAIIIASIGSAGLILYDQKKALDLGRKLASTDPSITDFNPAVQSNVELGGISAEAVASHSSSSDCWMVIDGNVYDFTKFLNSHPGGSSVMAGYCGKDGSQAFATKDKNPSTPHTQIANELLNQYLLGKLGSGNPGGNSAQNPVINPVTGKPITNLIPTTVPGTAVNTPATSSSSNIMTASTVAAHSSQSDCWIIINSNVYAVSNYLSSHPGGSGVIASYCGRDATAAFNTKDRNPGTGHSSFAVSQLGAYLVGRIGAATTANSGTGSVASFTPTPTSRINTPTPTIVTGGGGSGGGGSVTLTSTQVATHNTLQDCWMIASGRVYNLTTYITQHPGGRQAILDYCGRDGTTAFDSRGGSGSHSNNARNLLNGFYIGDLGSSVPVGSTPTPTPGGGAGNTATPTSSGGSSGIPTPVLQRYPDAVLIGSIKYEDDGRAEFRISTGGQCRKIKTGSSGEIREDEGC